MSLWVKCFSRFLGRAHPKSSAPCDSVLILLLLEQNLGQRATENYVHSTEQPIYRVHSYLRKPYPGNVEQLLTPCLGQNAVGFVTDKKDK